MSLELQNLAAKKAKLNGCNVSSFSDPNNSYRHFITKISVNFFRHIRDLTITFDHPITVISGTNKTGKTSLLLLLACSFERFMKIDSTSPSAAAREHSWKDVLTFTAHENAVNDYSYEMEWRLGVSSHKGKGTRINGTWNGLGKKSSDPERLNAKIRGREVRLIDLERMLPGRSFSSSLYRKANAAQAVRMAEDIEKAFAYIFDLSEVKLFEAGSHINKSCFLIGSGASSYSTYNAATGEEAVIYLLKDIILSPLDSLILIDEMEAGFHPSIQRKISDIIQYVSWRDKKQFVITTHSATLISSFSEKSRRFIEVVPEGYHVIKNISHQAASSKMDSIGYPLVRLYCEDSLASYLIKKALIRLSAEYPHFNRLINIVESGPINEVKNDYLRHKRNFPQYTNKIGFCAVFDGDYKDNSAFKDYYGNPDEKTLFIYPYMAPDKFLVEAYLRKHENAELRSAFTHKDHHLLFEIMVALGMATDRSNARDLCYEAFETAPEFSKHKSDLEGFLKDAVSYFSKKQDSER